ncbi:MAG: protein kinase [Kofleriaceae bacterium]|nr:protein kinase [Kofleriaceae bacterium]
MYFCPVCRQQFDSVGFCPFDRTELRAITATSEGAKTFVDQPVAAHHAAATVSSDPTRRGTAQGHLPAATHAPPNIAGMPRPPIAAAPAIAGAPRPGLRPTSQSTAESGYMPAQVPLPAVPRRNHSPSEMSVLSAAGDARSALAGLGKRDEYENMIGQTLDGRYRIEKKIGEGGMGVVFAAKHVIIERPLAIKVLRREVMRDTGTIKRFEQEAQAASRIGHPNIVDVTDFGTTPDGMTYSVMEYINGDTLARVNRQMAPLALPRIFRIAAQLARALGAAHDKGIVHRDLKPDNVFLVDRDGRADFVKIVDFGIAKMQPLDGNAGGARLTKVGSVFGTPEYMAPEQAAGRSDTDGRVDIYALGIIMYEMVTGKLPHKGDSTVRTIAMQMLDAPVPPTQLRPDLNIPPEFEAVILKALAKKREQRYQTMGELLAALEIVARQVMGPQAGASVTGSPAMALAQLPPGADPSKFSDAPGAPAPGSDRPAHQPSTAPSPRSRQPSTGYPRNAHNEPEFTASDRPKTFDHVFTEDEIAAPRARWPWIAVGLLMTVGVGGAVFLFLNSRAAPRSVDTRLAEVPPPDAMVIAHVPVDASVAIQPDAAAPIDAPRTRPPRRDASGPGPVVSPRSDARPTPAIAIDTPNGRGTYEVRVLTRPEGGTLYIGTAYRGPGGVKLEERVGTRGTVRCTMSGYKPGTVDILWDGNTEEVLCTMTRIKICINGIKNPFDDCEIGPTTGSAATPQ